MKHWKELLVLALLLIVGFTVRLYRFNGPIADWHSWRQADTSAVSRNFVKYGFDLLHPRMDNISNVQTNGAFENPKGYFFTEFPIYNAMQAGLYVLFGHFTIEEWGRLVTIVSSLISMMFLYLLSKKYANKTVGFFAVLFYALLPFSIYYSRTVLPQSSMTASLLAGVYFFDKALFDEKRKPLFGILSALFTALALLFSPYTVFYFPPFLYLLWKKWGFGLLRHWQPYVFVLTIAIPLALWRVWMLQYPEGIPANSWLLNGGNIRFTGAFFYWIFADRIGRLILGYWATGLLVLGLIVKRKNWGFFSSFFLGSILFVTVFAKGNVQHDYYQYIIVPSLVFLVALGSEFLWNPPQEKISLWMSRGVLILCIVGSLAFSWYFVRSYFDINNPAIVVAGHVADKILPKNAKVLTFYDGDSTFLYQINRPGWASMEKPLDQIISMGADYLVLADPTQSDFNGFGKMYKTVASSSQYLILDLHHSP